MRPLVRWGLRSGRITVHPEVEFAGGQHSGFSPSGVLASLSKQTPPLSALKIRLIHERHMLDCGMIATLDPATSLAYRARPATAFAAIVSNTFWSTSASFLI